MAAITVTWTAGYKDVVLNRNGDNFTLSWTPPTATRKVGDSDKDVPLRYQYIFVRLYGTWLSNGKTGFINMYRAYVSGSTNTVTFTVNITPGTGTTGKPIKKVVGEGAQGKPNENSDWVPYPFTNATVRLDSLRVYMMASVSRASISSHDGVVYGYNWYTTGGIDATTATKTKAWGDPNNPNTVFSILTPAEVKTKDGEAFVTHVGRNDSMLKYYVDGDFHKFRIDMGSGTDDTSRKWFYRLRWKLIAYALNRRRVQNPNEYEYDFNTPFEPNAYIYNGNNYVLYEEGGFNGSKYDHVADENGPNRFNDLSLSNNYLYFKVSSTEQYTQVPTDGSVPIYLLFCTKTQGPHGDSPWKILSFHWAKPEIPVVSSVTHKSKYLGRESSIVQIRARINPLGGWSPIGLGRRPASLASKGFPNNQIIEHYYVGDYLKLYYAKGVPTSDGFLSSDTSFEELQSAAMQYWNEEYIDFYHQRGYVDLEDDEAEFYMLEACHLPFAPVKSWQFRANCGKVKPPSSVSYEALTQDYKTTVRATTETDLTGVKYALVIKLQKPGDPTPSEDVVSWNDSPSQTPTPDSRGVTVSFGTTANKVDLRKYLTENGSPIENLVFTLGVKALPPDPPDDSSRYSSETVYVDGEKSGIRGNFLESDVTWAVSDTFPGKLTGLKIEPMSRENSIEVSWDGATTTYDTVEISWSDDPKAWSSTNQPSTFEVEDPNATTWYITGLEAGKTYYVRTRIKYDETSSRSEVFGPYSPIKDIKLVSVPATPTITAVSTKLPYNSRSEPVDLSWTYENEDGSTVEKSVLNIKSYNASGSLLKNKDVTIEGPSLARRIFLSNHMIVPAGGHCDITVRVSSKNDAESKTSDPVRIFFGAVPEITAPENLGGTSSGISAGNVSDGCVSASPITVPFATTSRLSGRVELVRCSNVRREKADGSIVYGFEGDVAWSFPIQSKTEGSSVASPEWVTMDLDLSQGERYKVRIVAANDFGESVFEGRTLTVDLAHRAIKPELVSVSEGAELGSAYVGAARPSGAASSDSLDIYRITSDGPQLVRSGADWMVDGHPEKLVLDLLSPQRKNGPAYRFVTRTSDGDESWIDVSWRGTVPMGLLVTYGEQTALFQWNAAPNIKWDKGFYENKHMGGKVTGGWRQAVSKNGTFSFDVINYDEEDIFDAIAEIGEYPGPCYVRAPHGIGFYANINPSYTRKQNELLTNVSFSYTRVDYEPDRSEQD